MAEISAQLVKQLREMNRSRNDGVQEGFQEANGDLAEAEVIFRKRGIAGARRKSRVRPSRAGERVHQPTASWALWSRSIASPILSARTEDFQTLGRDIAAHIAGTKPKYVRGRRSSGRGTCKFQSGTRRSTSRSLLKDPSSTVERTGKRQDRKARREHRQSRVSQGYELNGSGCRRVSTSIRAPGSACCSRSIAHGCDRGVRANSRPWPRSRHANSGCQPAVRWSKRRCPARGPYSRKSAASNASAPWTKASRRRWWTRSRKGRHEQILRRVLLARAAVYSREFDDISVADLIRKAAGSKPAEINDGHSVRAVQGGGSVRSPRRGKISASCTA